MTLRNLGQYRICEWVCETLRGSGHCLNITSSWWHTIRFSPSFAQVNAEDHCKTFGPVSMTVVMNNRWQRWLLHPTHMGAVTSLYAGTSPETVDMNGTVSPHLYYECRMVDKRTVISFSILFHGLASEKSLDRRRCIIQSLVWNFGIG
jgi:hypothetical protein